METLTSYLKSGRESKNISLEQIARDTRISLRHLKSLEEANYCQLPGGMYNRAFLRTYCEYIGLDPAEGIARYESEVAPPKEKAPKAPPKVSTENASFKVHPLALWSVMLLISATGLFLSRQWIGEIFAPYFSHPSPARIEPVQPPPPPPAAPSNLPAAASSAAPGPPASTNASTPAVEVEAKQPIADGPSVPATVAAADPLGPRPLRLEVEVLKACWVSLNSDGNRVLVRVLRPGEDQSFSAAEKFYLIAGNAGGIRLKINGKEARPLGKEGEVVRVLINEQSIKELLQKTTG